MPKAVLFDIDGTLLDSVDLHAQAWQETFHHFGYEFDLGKVRTQIGKGGDQLLPFFLSPEDVKSKGEEISKFRSGLFKDRYLSQVKAFPGTRELFERVKSEGQQVGLASSAKGDELTTFERIAKIEDLVEVEATSADAEKSKPYPDIFEAAFQRLKDGVSKSDVVIVGDSPHDAEAAVNAGIKVVGVRCGGFPEDDLLKAGCIAVYDGPEDLLDRYDQSPLAPSR